MALSLAMKFSAARTSAMLSVLQYGRTGCALAIRPHAATNHRRRSVRFRHQPELTTIRLQCKRPSKLRMIDGLNGAACIDLTGRERRPVGRGFHSRNSRSIESNDPSAIAWSTKRWSLTPANRHQREFVDPLVAPRLMRVCGGVLTEKLEKFGLAAAVKQRNEINRHLTFALQLKLHEIARVPNGILGRVVNKAQFCRPCKGHGGVCIKQRAIAKGRETAHGSADGHSSRSAEARDNLLEGAYGLRLVPPKTHDAARTMNLVAAGASIANLCEVLSVFTDGGNRLATRRTRKLRHSVEPNA